MVDNRMAIQPEELSKDENPEDNSSNPSVVVPDASVEATVPVEAEAEAPSEVSEAPAAPSEVSEAPAAPSEVSEAPAAPSVESNDWQSMANEVHRAGTGLVEEGFNSDAKPKTVGFGFEEPADEVNWFTVGDFLQGIGLGFFSAVEGLIEFGNIIPGVDYDVPDNFGLGHADTIIGRMAEEMTGFLVPFMMPGAGWIAGGARLGGVMGAKSVALINSQGRLARGAAKVQGGTLRLSKYLVKGLDKKLQPAFSAAHARKANLARKITGELSGVPLTGVSRYAARVRSGLHGAHAKAIGAIPNIVAAGIGGAMVDFFTMNPNEERLSNMIEQYLPGLGNPITKALMHKEGDSDLEGRIKLTLEGAGFGIMIDGVISGIRGGMAFHRAMKATGNSKNAAKAMQMEMIENNVSHFQQMTLGADGKMLSRQAALSGYSLTLGLPRGSIVWNAPFEEMQKRYFKTLYQMGNSVPKSADQYVKAGILSQWEAGLLTEKQFKEVEYLFESAAQGSLDMESVRTLAEIGVIVRGEYSRVHQAIMPKLFPANGINTVTGEARTVHDGFLWSNLNAILSANTGAEEHTAASMILLLRWTQKGRPTDETNIRLMLEELHDSMPGNTAAAQAWKETVNNVVHIHSGPKYKKLQKMFQEYDKLNDVLTAAEKENGITNGNQTAILDIVNAHLHKTRQFSLSHTSGGGVTIDVHMEGLGDPRVFSGSFLARSQTTSDVIEGTDEVRKLNPATMAYRMLVRKLGKDMGDEWLGPAGLRRGVEGLEEATVRGQEVQEAVWAPIVVIKGLLKRYRGNVDEVMNNLTEQDLSNSWDIGKVLQNVLTDESTTNLNFVQGLRELNKKATQSDEGHEKLLKQLIEGLEGFGPRRGMPDPDDATKTIPFPEGNKPFVSSDRKALRRVIEVIQQRTPHGADAGNVRVVSNSANERVWAQVRREAEEADVAMGQTSAKDNPLALFLSGRPNVIAGRWRKARKGETPLPGNGKWVWQPLRINPEKPFKKNGTPNLIPYTGVKAAKMENIHYNNTEYGGRGIGLPDSYELRGVYGPHPAPGRQGMDTPVAPLGDDILTDAPLMRGTEGEFVFGDPDTVVTLKGARLDPTATTKDGAEGWRGVVRGTVMDTPANGRDGVEVVWRSTTEHTEPVSVSYLGNDANAGKLGTGESIFVSLDLKQPKKGRVLGSDPKQELGTVDDPTPVKYAEGNVEIREDLVPSSEKAEAIQAFSEKWQNLLRVKGLRLQIMRDSHTRKAATFTLKIVNEGEITTKQMDLIETARDVDLGIAARSDVGLGGPGYFVTKNGYAIDSVDELTIVGDRAYARGNVRYVRGAHEPKVKVADSYGEGVWDGFTTAEKETARSEYAAKHGYLLAEDAARDAAAAAKLKDTPPNAATKAAWARGGSEDLKPIVTKDGTILEYPDSAYLKSDEGPTRTPRGITASALKVYRAQHNIKPMALTKRGAHPTQVATTVRTYVKLKEMLKKGNVLDVGAGKDVAKKAGIRADTVEPFPEEGFVPSFRDTADLADESYDNVINNAVLNTVTQEVRDGILREIGRVLKVGGKGFINVRGKDVLNAGHNVINKEGMEVIINSSGAYQKGFQGDELLKYVEDILGDGFDVRKSNSEFGNVSVVITKKKSVTLQQPRQLRKKGNKKFRKDWEPSKLEHLEVETPTGVGGLRTLFQTGEGEARGFTASMTDESLMDEFGRIFIGGLENSNMTTGVHETMHGVRLLHANRSIPEARRLSMGGNYDAEIDVLERAIGVEDGVWTVANEEKLARLWEKFVNEGDLVKLKGTSERDFGLLEVAFTRMSREHRKAMETFGGSLTDDAISPELRQFFNNCVAKSDVQGVIDALGSEARAFYENAAVGVPRTVTAERAAVDDYEKMLDEMNPEWRTPEGYEKMPEHDKKALELRRRRLYYADRVREKQADDLASPDQVAREIAEDNQAAYDVRLRNAEERKQSYLDYLDDTYPGGWRNYDPDLVDTLDPEDVADAIDDGVRMITEKEAAALRNLEEKLAEAETSALTSPIERFSSRQGEQVGESAATRNPRRDEPLNVRHMGGRAERRAGDGSYIDHVESGEDAKDLMQAMLREEEEYLARVTASEKEAIEEFEIKAWQDLMTAVGGGREVIREHFDVSNQTYRKAMAERRMHRKFAMEVSQSAADASSRLNIAREADGIGSEVYQRAQFDLMKRVMLMRQVLGQVKMQASSQGFEFQKLKDEPFLQIFETKATASEISDALDVISEGLGKASKGAETLEDYTRRLQVATEEGMLSLVKAVAQPAGDKLDAVLEIFYNSLLSGPRTHAVNTLSNAIYGVVLHFERKLGRAMLSGLGQNEEHRRAMGAFIGYRKILKESFTMMRIAIKNSSAQLDPQGGRSVFDSQRGVFEGGTRKPFSTKMGMGEMTPLVTGPLDFVAASVSLRGWPTRLLGGVDEFFKQMHNRLVVADQIARDATRLHAGDATAMAAYVEHEFEVIIGNGHFYTKRRVWTDGLKKAYEQGMNKTDAREFAERYVEDNYSEARSALAERALKFSRKSTFTSPNDPSVAANPMSGGVQKLGKALQAATKEVRYLRLVAPFINTPTNLLSEAMDHLLSPIFDGAIPVFKKLKGLLSETTEEAHKLIQGDETMDAAMKSQAKADALGRLALSSSIMTLVWMKVNSGEITGGGPSDPKAQRLLRKAGWQPYSVRFGNSYYGYGRLDPMASIFGIVADIAEGANGNPYTDSAEEEGIEGLMRGAMMALFRNVSEKSYLSGIINLASAVDNPEYYGKAFGQNLAAAAVPTLSAQVAGQLDPTSRQMRSIVDKWKSRIPFLGDSLIPKRNFLGEDEQRINYSGGPLLGLLSPVPTSEVSSDIIMREVTNYGQVTNPPGPIRHGTLDLREYNKGGDETAYDRLQELVGIVEIGGKGVRDSLENLIMSGRYERLEGLDNNGGSPRNDALKKVVRKYQGRAWRQLLEEYPTLKANEKIARYNSRARKRGGPEKDLLDLIGN
jgi:SAM-dependent methyltransferase